MIGERMSLKSGNENLHDVKVYDSGKFLGYLAISIDKDNALTNNSWSGQIRGSDYLVWGLNHRRVIFQFADGGEVTGVVRSGGRITPAQS